MMRRHIRILAVLLAALTALGALTSCGSDRKEAKKALTSFMKAYAEADYEAMKPYCTDEFAEIYFHEGDVFGNEWAKMDKCAATGRDREDALLFRVELTVKPEGSSALYNPYEPETSDTLIFLMEKQPDGNWKVAGIDR